MWFIGDCHGQFHTYLWSINKMQLSKDRGISCSSPVDDMPASMAQQSDMDEAIDDKMDCSLQIGDMGIFDEIDLEELPESKKHRFFRGNHDNPELCYRHKNYLQDYGYLEKQEMFVLAGGFSIDFGRRTPGLNWWEDEELSHEALSKAFEEYSDSKPKIMVSHECPTVIKGQVLTNVLKDGITSRTEAALQRMFESHKPDLWIFGHHHKRIDVFDDSTKGVRFVGLHELIHGPIKECIFEVPGLDW